MSAPTPRARVLIEAAAQRDVLDEDPVPVTQRRDKLYQRAVALMRDTIPMALARDVARQRG